MFSNKAIPKITLLCLSMLSDAHVMASNEIELARQPLDACSQADLSVGKQSLTGGPMETDGSGNIYRAQYDSASWTGTLKKFETIRVEDNSLKASDHATWDAASKLNSTGHHHRQIFTYNTATRSLIPFQLDQLSAEFQETFNRSPDSGQQDNLGVERINYLSGDRAMESPQPGLKPAQFRKRASVLGDILNSNPVYKGAAANNIVDKNYPPFFSLYKNRHGSVYIGANDGMLHAFSAEDGSELFAYIPTPLLGKLPTLTNPAYRHDTFMDGKIRVSEAQVSGNWLTVLAAGMGSGARGVFALDVTAPASFINGRGVLFEFTAQDDADIGFVTSAPLIAKLPGAKKSDGSLDYRYFVLVTSGYNASNETGDNYLFLLSLDKPAQSAWALGKNYYKIKAGSANPAAANALAGPGLVFNLQGAATRAYAGDLQGNVWRFDFTAAGKPAAQNATTVFSAADAANQAQPITVAPVIAYAPGGGYVILFGTGKYIETADINPAGFTGNSFYAIHDQTDQHPRSRSELAHRSLTAVSEKGTAGYRITGSDFDYGEGTARTKKGWFIDFPDSKSSGERMISEAAAEFGTVFFNTITPGTSCQKPASGKSYKLDLLTGKTAASDIVTGIKSPGTALGTPLLIDIKSESGLRDALGQRTATHYFSVLNFNSATDLQGRLSSDATQRKAGRQSWRELPDPGN